MQAKYVWFLSLTFFSLAFCAYADAGGTNWNIQVSPNLGFSQINGDEQRFREDRQIPNNLAGGIGKFTANKQEGEKRVSIEGRALSDRDFGTSISLFNGGKSYFNLNLDTFRYYYDSSNLFYGDAPDNTRNINVFELDDNLHTDRATFGFESGLNLADDKKAYVGFEHTERNGKASTYYGGWLRQASTNDWIIGEYPLAQEINYASDRIYAGFDTSLMGFKSKAKVELENFKGQTELEEPGRQVNGTDVFRRIHRNEPDFKNWTGSINSEKYFLKDKLLFNFGYQYQKVTTDAQADIDSYTPAGARYYANHSLNFIETAHSGKNTSHLTNLMLSLFPLDGLKAWAGLEYRRGKQKSDSTRGEEGAEETVGDGNTSTVDEYWFFDTVSDEHNTRESLGLEVSSLPKTKITLSADFDQKRTIYDQDANIVEVFSGQDDGDWHWKAKVMDFRNQYNVSVRSKPFNWLTSTSRYRYRETISEVKNRFRVIENKPGDPDYDTTIAVDFLYPGRIGNWRRPSHKFNLGFDAKLNPKLSVRPHYEYYTEEFFVSGEPVDEIATTQSHAYGFGLDMQPTDKLSFVFDITERDAYTATRANDFTNTEGIDPATGAASTQWYGGLTDDFDSSAFSTNGTAYYQLSKGTLSLNSGYTEGNGWFATELFNVGAALSYPLKDNTTLNTGYTYYNYEEKNNGGINDYEAHLLYASMKMIF